MAGELAVLWAIPLAAGRTSGYLEATPAQQVSDRAQAEQFQATLGTSAMVPTTALAIKTPTQASFSDSPIVQKLKKAHLLP